MHLYTQETGQGKEGYTYTDRNPTWRDFTENKMAAQWCSLHNLNPSFLLLLLLLLFLLPLIFP